MMKSLRKIVSLFSVLALLVVQLGPADAAFRRGAPPQTPSGFNGHKTQVNFTAVQCGGDYPWLNALKGAQQWSYSNGAQQAVLPSDLDANLYLKNNTGNAASGLTTTMCIPSQQQRPGAYVVKSVGNGGAGTGNATVAPLSYAIDPVNLITQSGGVQTINLTTIPVEMKALQPININSNLGNGSGNWASFNGGWRVQDVGVGCAVTTRCFRINSGNTYTGVPSLGGSNPVNFTNSTSVQNPGLGGLNGSSRYVVLPDATVGGADGTRFGASIISIASSTDYPHDIKIFHIDDEALIDAGQVFTTKFLSITSNFGVLRFLNWQNENISNVSTWNTRTPITAAIYGGYWTNSDWYTGSTTLTNATFTVSAPAQDSATGAAWSGTIHDKTTIHTSFAQSGRQAASFTGTTAFNSGIGLWEVTINSGLTGFVGIGQALRITGQTDNYIRKIISGSGSVWQLDPSGGTGAASSVAMTTYQNFNSPAVTFPAGNSSQDITIAGNTYQTGDQIYFQTFSNGATFPSNVAVNTRYYVVSSTLGVAGTIKISASPTLTPILTINCTVTCGGGDIRSNIYLFMTVSGATPSAVPIFAEYSTDLSDFTNSFPVSKCYCDLATLVYDATLGGFIKYGGDISVGAYGIVAGVPPELNLQLSWAVGAHPWMPSPPLAIDPITDYWPQLMNYDKLNKPSWAVARWEPPNELWNTGVGFFQTGYANAKSAAYHVTYPSTWPLTSDYHNWYGKSLSALGQVARQVYGPGKLNVDYQMIGGVQTAISVLGDLGNAYPRFAATNYVNTGVAQSPLTVPGVGTFTFTADPPAPNVSQPSATPLVSHIAVASYYSANVRSAGDGATQSVASMGSAYGAVTFAASSIVGGLMTIAPFTSSGLTTGHTVFLPDQTTFTIVSGSDGAGWTISNSSLNIPYQQSYIAALTSGLSQATLLANDVVDTVVHGSITGCPGACSLGVTSIVSGNTIAGNLGVYGGTSGIPWGTGVYIQNAGQTYPNYPLSGCSGACTNMSNKDFQIGTTFSLSGNYNLYYQWANWAKSNFGIAYQTYYEGGRSDDYALGTAFNLLSQQAKQVAVNQSQATLMFDAARGLGSIPLPAGVTGEFPSNYLLTGPYPTGTAWSLLDDIYQNPTSPQWKAIQAYPFLLKRDLDPASNDNDPMWLEKAA